MTPGKSPSKQAHDRRCGAMFRCYLGSKCQVATLSILDWNRFLRDRGAGRIGPRHGANKPAGPRQIQYDLKHLRAVLQWATLSRVDGRPLLERNPLAGLPLPREDSPKRPVMDQPYYELLLAIAPQCPMPPLARPRFPKGPYRLARGIRQTAEGACDAAVGGGAEDLARGPVGTGGDR